MDFIIQTSAQFGYGFEKCGCVRLRSISDVFLVPKYFPMRSLAFVFLTLFSVFLKVEVSAQIIYSKDSVAISDAKELVRNCVENEDIINLAMKEGISFDVDGFCYCMVANIYSAVHSSVLLSLAETPGDPRTAALEVLLQEPDAIKAIIGCVENMITYESDFTVYGNEIDSLTQAVAVIACVEEIMSDEDIGDIRREDAERYCWCAIGSLAQRGYSMAALNDIDNEDSEMFVEIVMPCVQMHLFGDDGIAGYNNVYSPMDISGDTSLFIQVPLKSQINNTYKIKVKIGEFSRYYLFDTGASDMVINREMEKKLRDAGVIHDSLFVANCTYTLANNDMVEAQTYLVDGVHVGGYIVDNVHIDVFDNATLIMGMGFLNKFSNWQLSEDKEMLFLWR